MPAKSLYLTSNQRGARKTSRGEIEWLSYLESQGKKIIHAYNSPDGQVRVHPYFVDGFEPCRKTDDEKQRPKNSESDESLKMTMTKEENKRSRGTVYEFLGKANSLVILSALFIFFFQSTFSGCAVHYHGGENKQCPKTKTVLPADTNPFGVCNYSVHQAWLKKKRHLECLNYTVVAIWECEYEKKKKDDPELALFSSQWEHPEERMKLRQCLKGSV